MRNAKQTPPSAPQRILSSDNHQAVAPDNSAPGGLLNYGKEQWIRASNSALVARR